MLLAATRVTLLECLMSQKGVEAVGLEIVCESERKKQDERCDENSCFSLLVSVSPKSLSLSSLCCLCTSPYPPDIRRVPAGRRAKMQKRRGEYQVVTRSLS